MQRIPAAAALVVTAWLALVSPPAAAAQEAAAEAPRAFRVGLRAGVGLPLGFLAGTGADEGLATTGFGFAGMATVRTARLPVALRGELAYDRFGADLDLLDPQDEGLSGSWGILAGLVNVVAEPSLGAAVRPYLLAGVGVYRAERKLLVDGERVPGGGAETSPGLNGGGGLRFRVGRFDSFVEARYHTLFADTRLSYVPIAVGVEF